MSTSREATEASLLIPAIGPDTGNEEESHPQDSEWKSDAIRTSSLASAFLILYAFADILKYISTVRLIELGVCREYYLKTDPDHIGRDGNIPESLCKSSGIQQRLAHLRGYLAALESIVGLLLALPYGLVVERIGERTLAAINIIGYLLSCAWIVLVCFYWSAFPIWSVVLSPLFRLVGGGNPVLSSIIYSIAAKNVPESVRSLCFFLFLAAQLLTEIVAIIIGALLLDHDFLFTPMILNLPLGMLCIITLFFIRPSKSLDMQLENHDEQDEDHDKLSTSVRRSISTLSHLFHDRNAVVLLATVPVARLLSPVLELMLQYIPKKFDMSLASASRLLSIQALESLILLVVILPVLKNVTQVRYHVMPAKVDLYIMQYGFVIMSCGCLIMAFSQTLMVFISGIMVLTIGCSTRPALQSVLTGLVDRKHIAVLYTVIALGDGIGTAAGALILNRSLAIAIGWEDKLYLGLPFLVGAVCYIFGFAGSLFAGHAAMKSKRND